MTNDGQRVTCFLKLSQIFRKGRLRAFGPGQYGGIWRVFEGGIYQSSEWQKKMSAVSSENVMNGSEVADHHCLG